MLEKKKTIKTAVVTYKEFSEWDFVPPGSYYVRTALGDYLFLKTSDRAAAQEYVNKEFGKGKYTVVAAKIEQGKSRLESGGYSCTGTSTRRGQKR
jgi:fibronectin type 3 domain-containing protein